MSEDLVVASGSVVVRESPLGKKKVVAATMLFSVARMRERLKEIRAVGVGDFREYCINGGSTIALSRRVMRKKRTTSCIDRR